VAATETSLTVLAPALDERTLLMDVGSTKGDVVQAAQRSLGNKLPCFVPAHPIAGSERAGVEAAHAGLYRGQPLILTPLPETGAGQLARAEQLWQALGCHVKTMTPASHDATFAAVSHLPHLLAFAFINGLAAQAQGSQFMSLAGPGFRDFSRIAASDPTVWRDIFAANAPEILRQLGDFRHALDTLEDHLKAIAQPHEAPQHLSALEQAIAQASAVRSQWKNA
jgi:prephenate dehydrogenase